MKTLPYITLALCVAFLVYRQNSVSTKSEAVATLRERVAVAAKPGANPERNGRRAAGPPNSTAGAGAAGDPALPDSVAEIDLLELVEAIRASQTGGVPNVKAMMRIQTLILKATPEELRELIGRTEALDVEDKIKQGLLEQFVRGLAEQDPKAALEVAFASEYLDLDEQRWSFSQSFAKWAEDDPAAAVAWFDRELAKGTFESKSLHRDAAGRLAFETTAVAALLETNPDRARERLLALPEDERRSILQDSHRFELDDTAAAHARLVRATIPEEEQGKVLASAAQDMLHRDGYEQLAAYADTVEATPSEREEIVRAAIDRRFQRFGWESDTPTPEDITEMRTFLQQQTPTAAERLTGEALAKYAGSGNRFAQAVELLDDVHAANPNDDLLAGFLMTPEARHNNAHDEARRELANRISDPARRQEVLEALK